MRASSSEARGRASRKWVPRRLPQRAERELLATGETARKRTIETTDDLTPHEARIARMARDGASNQDIATELFVSRKTVEYHLHKVFPSSGSAPASSSTACFRATEGRSGLRRPE